MWTCSPPYFTSNVFPPLSIPAPRPPLLPASAQTSNIIFGAALATALPRHTQRKVPLLLARYGPVSCGLLAKSRGPLSQRGQRPLLPVKSQEVCQGVRGAERRGVICELCVRMPAVPVVLHCNVTEGTPLERIWRQKRWLLYYSVYQEQVNKRFFLEDYQHRNYSSYSL